MKPYSALPDSRGDVGCCPGHDWPVCYRWAGKHSGRRAKKNSSMWNKIGKRARRRIDKQNGFEE